MGDPPIDRPEAERLIVAYACSATGCDLTAARLRAVDGAPARGGSGRLSGHAAATSRRCSTPPRWPSWAPPTTPRSGATGWPAAPFAAHDRRPVYLVNRNGGEVLGARAYTSVKELPEAPELVVIAVPAAGFEQAVDDSLAVGARALVGITAGLGEAGGDAAARERALVQRVRDAGAMLLGPNCLGVFDAVQRPRPASNEFPAGSIGLISQSGNLALELGMLARRYGLGFSRFASIGNQADLDLAELVASYAAHQRHRADRGLRRGLPRRARLRRRPPPPRGKPVILITVGRSDASARAAAVAHRRAGQLAAAVDAACRARRRAPGLDPGRDDRPRAGAAAAAAAGRPPDRGARRRRRPRRDRLRRRRARAGWSCRAVATGCRRGWRRCCRRPSATRNPVDLAGAGEHDFTSYSRAARDAARGRRGRRRADDRLLRRLQPVLGGVPRARDRGRPGRSRGRPPRPESRSWPSRCTTTTRAQRRAARAAAFPSTATIEAAAAALAALAPRGRGRGRAGAARRRRPAAAGRRLLRRPCAAGRGRRAVRGGAQAHTARRCWRRRAEVGYPVVLKALGLLHKSDAGGVGSARRRGCAGRGVGGHGAAAGARRRTRSRRWRRCGRRRADRGRPARPPLRPGRAGRPGRRLRRAAGRRRGGAGAARPWTRRCGCCTRCGCGAAGRRARARRRRPGAAADAAVALSRLAAARPDIAEIEVNPLLVLPHGALRWTRASFL